jgi:hypothetical protein
MDASSSQSQPGTDAPRHLFFGAEDRRLGGRAGLTDKYLTMEKARRHQLAEHVINTANQLANAVRTLRTFDRTGSAEQALAHIEATFEDLGKQTRNLVDEVNAAVERHEEGLAELAIRPTETYAGEPEYDLADNEDATTADPLPPMAPRFESTPLHPSDAARAVAVRHATPLTVAAKSLR